MKKFNTALLFALVIGLVFVGSALAETYVTYDDTASKFDTPAGIDPVSLIRNGAFDNWENSVPKDWSPWWDSKAGWEDAHIAMADMAYPAGNKVGDNPALGFFIRHTGGTGGYYAGAQQKLNQITEDGYYFVQISETIWYDVSTGPYNSVAWYAISTESDPANVTNWHELDPYTIQCPNALEHCTYEGRDETVYIEKDSYFHLKVGQKFPVFGAETVFIIDDISIVAADGTDTQYNGFYMWQDDFNADLTDDKCHYYDETCGSTPFVEVMWDQYAPR